MSENNSMFPGEDGAEVYLRNASNARDEANTPKSPYAGKIIENVFRVDDAPPTPVYPELPPGMVTRFDPAWGRDVEVETGKLYTPPADCRTRQSIPLLGGALTPTGALNYPDMSVTNPKTFMGKRKLPMFSVVSPASMIYEADAMRYGAFDAPRVDGKKGYGPFNWRENPIEASVYVDAAARHIMAWQDGEDLAADSLVHHLAHAKATLGIIIDALESGTLIDDRPKIKSGVASRLLAERTKKF